MNEIVRRKSFEHEYVAHLSAVRKRLMGTPCIKNVRAHQIYLAQKKKELEEARKAQRQLNKMQRIEIVDARMDILAVKAAKAAAAELEWATIKPADTKWSMDQIAQYVLQHFPGLTLDAVREPGRKRYAFNARRVIATAIKDMRPDVSYPAIGRFLHRDHTSILNAIRRGTKE